MLHRICSNVPFVYTNTIYFKNGFVHKDPRFRQYDIHVFPLKETRLHNLLCIRGYGLQSRDIKRSSLGGLKDEGHMFRS